MPDADLIYTNKGLGSQLGEGTRLTLVTGNARHFGAIPRLPVEDWIND